MDDLDSFMQTCSIPGDIDNTGAALWRDNETTYTLDEFTCPSYNSGEASYSKKDLLQSAKWRLHEPFCLINNQSQLTKTTTGERGQLPTEKSALSLDDVPPQTADHELKIVRTWLTKLWMAFQNPSSTSDPEDGAEYGSRDQQSGRESIRKKGGNQESSNTAMSSQESSKTGQKRSRQPPRTPDSDDEDDDDGDAKKPGGGGFRGRGPRMLNEFGCPFFKHDPETHGGRGGCREYSHISVGILLRDHIGIKHLRNNDLGEAKWLELKQTKHRQGAARYKEIYAKLFPGDEAGIANPYFVEYPLPTSWSERAPHLRAAEFVTAAMQFLESITRIEEERSEKESQIRSHAESDLREVQSDLESRMKQLKASASHKEVQVRHVRDEQLKRLGSEMSQRRQAIRARLESIIHGQSSTTAEDSTNPGTPSLEAEMLQMVSIDQTHSVGGETEISEWDRSSHSNLGDRTVSHCRSISFGDWS